MRVDRAARRDVQGKVRLDIDRGANSGKLVAELKAKGIQVDAVDRKPFVDASKSVYTKWEASPIGDFVKRVVQQAN